MISSHAYGCSEVPLVSTTHLFSQHKGQLLDINSADVTQTIPIYQLSPA